MQDLPIGQLTIGSIRWQVKTQFSWKAVQVDLRSVNVTTIPRQSLGHTALAPFWLIPSRMIWLGWWPVVVQRLFLPCVKCRSNQLIPHMAITQNPQADRRHLYKTTLRTPAHSEHHKVCESSKMAKPYDTQEQIWCKFIHKLCKLVSKFYLNLEEQIHCKSHKFVSKFYLNSAEQIHLQITQICQQILSKLGRANSFANCTNSSAKSV